MAFRGQVRNAASLGLMLQQGRLARGLSQRDLAAELGLSQRWVSEMEAGKPGKLTERLFAMLDATGVRLIAEIDVPARSGNDAEDAGPAAAEPHHDSEPGADGVHDA